MIAMYSTVYMYNKTYSILLYTLYIYVYTISLTLFLLPYLKLSLRYILGAVDEKLSKA